MGTGWRLWRLRPSRLWKASREGTEEIAVERRFHSETVRGKKEWKKTRCCACSWCSFGDPLVLGPEHFRFFFSSLYFFQYVDVLVHVGTPDRRGILQCGPYHCGVGLRRDFWCTLPEVPSREPPLSGYPWLLHFQHGWTRRGHCWWLCPGICCDWGH